MSARRETFQVAGTPRLRVALPSGIVRLLPGAPGTVEVTVEGANEHALAAFLLEQRGDLVTVRPSEEGFGRRLGAFTVTVSLPADTEVDANLAAADLEVETPLGSLTGKLASGEVSAEDIDGDVVVRTASGGLRLGAVAGRLDLTSASGDVDVREAGGACSVSTASGDIRVQVARHTLTVKTASGGVRVAEFSGSDVKARTMSGDVELGFPPGLTLTVDLSTLSGHVRNDFGVEQGVSGAARVTVQTLSGDIVLRPAVPTPPRPPTPPTPPSTPRWGRT